MRKRESPVNFDTEITGTGILSRPYSTVHHGDMIPLGKSNTFTYSIKAPHGLHARPAGKLAEIAQSFDCEITICANGRSASAKSPFDLINLGADQGTDIIISAEGRQAQAAIKALKAFLVENL